MLKTVDEGAGPELCILGDCDALIFGRSPADRTARQLAKARSGKQKMADGAVLLVRADAVLDQPLIPAFAAEPGFVLVGDGPTGPKPLAAHVTTEDVEKATAILTGRSQGGDGGGFSFRTPAELRLNFWKSLRKRETPYAMAVSAADAGRAEWRIFMGTYKGATDIVTKHLWPVPAFHATRWLAARGVTPNAVTTVGAILMMLAFWLFWRGDFALGLIAAWLMTFLDTVDGKLACTTMTSSTWGDIFDHGIDLVHPPFWYVAWALGLGAVGLAYSDDMFWLVIGAILGGYVLQRVMEGIAIKWLGLEIHIWRKIDTLFRQITARRNPNLILMTAGVVAGRPDLGLTAVAIWTVACLVLHGVQLIHALWVRRLGPLTSWMTKG
ncbi:MAG: CDP-alcohol phosphatidyltransferase family protein [Alphaproteobacteria bacterium]|nr:CDP-alcohol phosphatidyltransferase family protein [Alphaproteobacteria bacterium]